jgi:phosphoribosylglycinamide formyltransferase-1
VGRLRLGVLISGSGTNLQAIIDACNEGRLNAEVRVVISNHDTAFGLERARRSGIRDVYVDRAKYDRPKAYNAAILQALRDNDVDTVVMAGYMRLLGTSVLEAYPYRVLNIHPALLPSFAGANGIHDAFDYGVKLTGVTVHFADENFDRGPIIAQEAVRIEEDDTVEDVESKIHAVEHVLYPQALQWLAEGRIRIEGRKVRILPAP